MATANKLRKFIAVVLALTLALSTMPITAAASPMEVTFVSAQQSGKPVGDYFVDFTAGYFPFMYEAAEGDSLVFWQYVTVTAGGGFDLDEVTLPPLLPPLNFPNTEVPVLEEYGEYSENNENGNGETQADNKQAEQDPAVEEPENGSGYGSSNGETGKRL